MNKRIHLQGQERHQKLHKDVADLLKKHLAESTEVEVMAVLAHILGQVLALQDQTTMTKDRAMDIIAKNIELGNAHAIETLLGQTIGNA